MDQLSHRYTTESTSPRHSTKKVMTAGGQKSHSKDTKQVLFSPQEFIDSAVTNPVHSSQISSADLNYVGDHTARLLRLN